MSQQTAVPELAPPALTSVRKAARNATAYWWVGLVGGILWVTAALVILQFDHASVTTVGVLVGLLFAGAGAENLWMATLDVPMRWLWALFGGLFLVAGISCFAHPEATFIGLADRLGFLFLIVALWWIIRAFIERPLNPLWWMGLVSGVLMTIIAFWTSGQFFFEKAYVLLVFAGIWALMQGVTSIVRGLQVRELHDEV